MSGNRKKHTKLLPLACALGLCMTAAPALAQAEDAVCTARFEWDSVEFNQEEFRSCLEQNSSSQWQQLNILGWASPPGPAEYNQELSERRANTMAEFLRSHVDNVEITRIEGRGENAEIGRAAQVFVLQRRGEGADGVALGQLNDPPAAAEDQTTSAPEESRVSDAQPVNPGFAPGPDANPGDATGDNVIDVSPTPGFIDNAQQTAPVQNLEAPVQRAERGRDMSWLGALGLVGLVPFLRKRRSGVE